MIAARSSRRGQFRSVSIAAALHTRINRCQVFLYVSMVEHRRFELLTSSMRTKRATNCANAPHGPLTIQAQLAYATVSIGPKSQVTLTAWSNASPLSRSR